MRKNIILPLAFLLIITGFNACSVKDTACTDKTIQSEDATMASFAATLGVPFTKHSSGVYYYIASPGSGATPTNTSTVYVKYTGKLLNGTVFDTQTTAPVPYTLGGLILGWQVALPLIQKGGVIKIIVPSSLGYGCRGFGAVPGNSITYFEIELTDVQ